MPVKIRPVDRIFRILQFGPLEAENEEYAENAESLSFQKNKGVRKSAATKRGQFRN